MNQYIYLIHINEIDEILIPSNPKFSKHFAYLNLLPYCFVSGSIQDGNILNSFMPLEKNL